MSMCRVFSCVVGRGCLLWPVRSLGKILLAFALLHSVFQERLLAIKSTLLFLRLKICRDLWNLWKFLFWVLLFPKAQLLSFSWCVCVGEGGWPVGRGIGQEMYPAKLQCFLPLLITFPMASVCVWCVNSASYRFPSLKGNVNFTLIFTFSSIWSQSL